MQKNILLYGGTYNPVHNGHLIIARSVAEQLKINKVILIPSASPPEKSDVLDFEHRLAMLHRAILDDTMFEVSTCEANRAGPSYTRDTVRWFRKMYGRYIDNIYWLIGEDILPNFAGWHGVEDLTREAIIVTASRPGYDTAALWQKWQSDPECSRNLEKINIDMIKDNILSTPQINISSSEIRNRVKNNLSIKNFVPDGVEEYIRERNFYKV